MPPTRSLIGDDIRSSWREFAPLLIELARHNLPLLDRTWDLRPEWRLLRDALVPMLLGTPYRFVLHRPSGHRHQPTLDTELIPDANRCLNLIRAKIWQRLGPRCSVHKSAAMIEQIIQWMEHLTLGCSMDPELIQMDFAIDLPEVGSIVHHNNRYGLVHASAAGSTPTLVSNMAATNRVAALVDDKFQALRDWLGAQPNGVEDLAKLLSQMAFELEELRFGTNVSHSLPEYMSVSFSMYDGEQIMVHRVRVRKRAPTPVSQFDQPAVLASLHVRRTTLLGQRRQRSLAGALAAFVPQPQEAFDSSTVMAKRWRWLIHYPHALTTLRSVLESLPLKVFGEPRHVLEYVNLQVDIAILESNWEENAEFSDLLAQALDRLDLARDMDQCDDDPDLVSAERQASTWWLWFSVTGAPLWAKRTAACLDQAQQPLASAMSRARQNATATGVPLEAALDQALRESGHDPEGLLTPTKSDPFYSDMLRAFSGPARPFGIPILASRVSEVGLRRVA
ncbi:hypothetical protein RAS12_30445 (plasmid) [Achromobacter seleniivolatilans]|uniref:Uncharacterized protein n=1 Tax=Achromobacter seleniivolatilans TaxID=3047478 RepID=A0ABY9MB43_9BURK|nr:hypothetical protein [Achromobacter sp. R39]WMD23955.1 hypothetical protein RAS12_30445 [Achromobacter sp. R39]